MTNVCRSFACVSLLFAAATIHQGCSDSSSDSPSGAGGSGGAPLPTEDGGGAAPVVDAGAEADPVLPDVMTKPDVSSSDGATDVNVSTDAAPEATMEAGDGEAPDTGPPTCRKNGTKDGDETDVDCGGSLCPACAISQGCVSPADCESLSCVALRCKTPKKASCAVPVQVDGFLEEEEWPDAWYQVTKVVIGDSSLGTHAEFQTRWDSKNLYVAVKFYDNQLTTDSGDKTWLDSSVEYYFDMQDDQHREYEGADDGQYRMRWGLLDSIFMQPGNKTQGIVFAEKAWSGGWTIEVAFPFNTVAPLVNGVPAITPASGTHIGFDMAYNIDHGTNGGDRDAQLVWVGTANDWKDLRFLGRTTLMDDCAAESAPH